MRHLLVVRRTGNAKLGPKCASTFRPMPDSCPKSCPYLDAGCYVWATWAAEKVGWSRSRNDDLDLAKDAEVIRHHVTGDVFLNDKLDEEYVEELLAWHRNHPKVRGWIYTHRIKDWNEAGFGPEAIPPNLVVLASVDTPEEAVEAHKLGWRTARIVKEGGLMLGEAWCRVDTLKAKGKLQDEIKTTCSTCGNCWKGGRSQNVALHFIEGGAKRLRGRKRRRSAKPRASLALVAAADWLRMILAEKPLPVTEVERLAAASGHSMPTVLRAKVVAGVQSSRAGFGPGSTWHWALKPTRLHR